MLYSFRNIGYRNRVVYSISVRPSGVAARSRPEDGDLGIDHKTMNVLALIKKKALKKAALQAAQKELCYRGIKYTTFI